MRCSLACCQCSTSYEWIVTDFVFTYNKYRYYRSERCTTCVSRNHARSDFSRRRRFHGIYSSIAPRPHRSRRLERDSLEIQERARILRFLWNSVRSTSCRRITFPGVYDRLVRMYAWESMWFWCVVDLYYRTRGSTAASIRARSVHWLNHCEKIRLTMRGVFETHPDWGFVDVLFWTMFGRDDPARVHIHLPTHTCVL